MTRDMLFTGIDLGTTNSAAATVSVQNGRISSPTLEMYRYTALGGRRPKRERRALLPSNVAYCEQNDGTYITYVGDFAKKLAMTQPYAVACSIKSQMGQSKVDIPGWKSEYPDQKPEEVSSRILKHIIQELDNQFYTEMTDAVITIPACFQPAQRQATLKAAELAGLRVRREDGSYWEELLLTEPEAVVYDVINQAQNGTIHLPIDFETPKKVLVFDIGGGTLDITLHEISKNAEHPEMFDIKPIAINRYSTVAGDTFDRALAEWMYERYLKDYQEEGVEMALRIQKNKEQIMASLLRYAEELKQDISEKVWQQRERGRILSADEEFEYGGEMPNGYPCDSYMNLGEFEQCLLPLLGEPLCAADYTRMNQLNERTIIYPILDVLAKAKDKLGEEPQVDAVIMNGGMSRLYLIEDRLERFFGFHPIKSNDPDKSVAQGAAIYHYYLEQNDSFIPVHQTFMQEMQIAAGSQLVPAKGIRSVGSVLNEHLYLGLRGGSVHLLAKSGQDLPYTSERMDGFSIPAGLTRLDIPIKQENRETHGYRTIAVGRIHLSQRYTEEKLVSIRFAVSRNSLLSFEAWIDGMRVGMTEIMIGETDAISRGKSKQALIPPAGTHLIAANELSILTQNLRQMNNRTTKTALEQVRSCKKRVISCGNPQDFASGILKMLAKDQTSVTVKNVMPIARRLCPFWTDEERRQLSRQCLSVLNRELIGWGLGNNANANAYIEAIHTLGICGSKEDCTRLTALCDKSRYRSALLYAFGNCGVKEDWVYEQFVEDWESGASIQTSLQALGLSLYRSEKIGLPVEKVAEDVMEFIRDYRGKSHELTLALVTLGMVCTKCTDAGICAKAQDVLRRLPEWYDTGVLSYCAKAAGIAARLLEKTELHEEEEQYLLQLLADTTVKTGMKRE